MSRWNSRCIQCAGGRRDRRTSRSAVVLLGLAALVAAARVDAQTPDAPTPLQRLRANREARSNLERRTWQVDGVEREALLFIPPAAKSQPAPVVFAFHGHGGNMQNAAGMFRMHLVWPEAIAVYMQGLNTPGMLTDPEGKRPGWQSRPGAQEDRDLKFFDAVLASLRAEGLVDDRRLYATGHSNGGGFTYLLWRTRGEQFAAFAPSAAAGPGAEWLNQIRALPPRPVLHLAGEQDPLVRFDWQQRTMEQLRKINGCEPTGREWAPNCTLYSSAQGTPVVTLIHAGAHNFPTEAPELFARFFREHARP